MTRHTPGVAAMLLAAACAHGSGTASSRPTVASQMDSGEVRVVRQLWESYLASKHGHIAANARTPSPLWSAAEQHRWPLYDLVAAYIDDGTTAQTADVRSTGAGGHEYEIVTAFSGNSDPAVSATVVTTSVYAVLENGRWVLANALPRKTARWERKTVAPIHYVIEPGLAFDSARAIRAAAFVDSLADALGVPRLESLEYYVASSVDAALNALGVQYATRYGSNGGFAKPVNRQLFSGNPRLGENYRHELTHVVVLPLLEHSPTTILASEGFSTWLGGTEGDDFRGSVRALRQYLTAHPSVTLDSAIDAPSVPQAVRYSAGAVLCDMLFKAGGTAAITDFLEAGPADVRSVVARWLRGPWSGVDGDWRRAVDHLASSSQTPLW